MSQIPIISVILKAQTDEALATELQQLARAAAGKGTHDSEEMKVLLNKLEVSPESLASLSPNAVTPDSWWTTLTICTLTSLACTTTTTTTTSLWNVTTQGGGTA